MDTTDSAGEPEEFLYEYDPEKGFDFEEFVRLSTGVMYEFFEDTDCLDLDTGDDPCSVDIRDVVYDEEIRDMFDRMGIGELRGRKDAVFVRDMTYIEAVVSYFNKDHKGRDEEHLGRFPLNLTGRIIIYPKGLTIFT